MFCVPETFNLNISKHTMPCIIHTYIERSNSCLFLASVLYGISKSFLLIQLAR